MPADALPQPWPATLPGLVHHERQYRDVLGRPMRGSVRVVGAKRAEYGDLVVTEADVTVQLVDGRLSVDLPPGTYETEATLTSPDGQRLKESETVTLSQPANVFTPPYAYTAETANQALADSIVAGAGPA